MESKAVVHNIAQQQMTLYSRLSTKKQYGAKHFAEVTLAGAVLPLMNWANYWNRQFKIKRPLWLFFPWAKSRFHFLPCYTKVVFFYPSYLRLISVHIATVLATPSLTSHPFTDNTEYLSVVRLITLICVSS